jgi:hypothetical protein
MPWSRRMSTTPLGTTVLNTFGGPTGLEYEWDNPETGPLCRTVVHYAVCDKTGTDAQGVHHGPWAWAAAHPLSKGPIVTRCYRMARHRWDIEEHSLVDKT